MASVWNPTEGVYGHDVIAKFDGRSYRVKPGDIVRKLSSLAAKSMQRDFEGFGLVALEDEAGPAEKEAKRVQGLTALYEASWQELLNWLSHTDEQRNRGVSVIGENRRVKQLKRIIATLEEALELEQRMNPEVYEQLKNSKSAPSKKKATA